jgi:hypothetical protein
LTRANRRAVPCARLRPCREILAVEIKKIEQKEHEAGGIADVGRQLDHAERGDAVVAHAAQLAVEIALARAERRDGPGYLRIFVGPVEAVAGQEPHLAAIKPGVHAEAVVFDFMQPLAAVRRFFHELRKLRAYPVRQGGFRYYGAHHGGEAFERRVSAPARRPARSATDRCF